MIEITPTKLMPKPGPLMRTLIVIAGVDEDTLRECPQHDWDCVRASALLFVAVWIYQTAIFSIVGHNLFARDGQFHPAIVLGAAFIAIFILLLDSYVFNRASYYRDGLRELKRGGIDLGGGFIAGIKAMGFLAIRILVLSLPMAQLTAIFFGLTVFHADIAADRAARFQQQNAALIAKATIHVDAEIADARAAMLASEAHVAALQKQLVAMRTGVVDPTANDPTIAAAEDQLNQLIAEKARRDKELEAAQAFASAELAGQKIAAGNSGVPGRGPVRIAAEERVRNATNDANAVDDEIAAVRAHLDSLRTQLASGTGGQSARSEQMLPSIERDLNSATTDRNSLRKRFAGLTADRDREIREEVEDSPNCIKESAGFIGQLRSLRRIAHDPEIFAVIILIDIVSFGLELAAVLAKVTSYVPMEYTARLARDAYLRVVRIATEIDTQLHGSAASPLQRINDLPPVSSSAAATNGPHDGLNGAFVDPARFTSGSGQGNSSANGATPPKRKRGRPRKYPPPATAS